MRRRISFGFLMAGLVGAQVFSVGEGFARSKVVIIGFDGADATLVQQWMDAGELPNLAQLAADGSFAPLAPTNPPQTPVSWSSFATGTDPGRTEIFDFLKRNPDDYLPDFAMNSETRRPFGWGERNPLVLGLAAALLSLLVVLVATWPLSWRWPVRGLLAFGLAVSAGVGVGIAAGRWLPVEVPDAINHRKGATLWELAAAAGRKVQVIRVPATFPAEALPGGHMLSGLGVPDMRGRVGTPSLYISDPQFRPGDNEFSLEWVPVPARRGTIETRIVGPQNKPFFDYVVDRRLADVEPAKRSETRRRLRRELEAQGLRQRLDVPLTLEVSDETCTIRLGEQTQTLRVGDWSDWIQIDFEVNPLVDRVAPLRGIARFKLLKLSPDLELYLSPINFHPDCHPVAFSWPPDYSEALARRFGLYKTIGWALDTWSLPTGVGDENLFLEDMDFTESQYEKMMEGLLAEDANDLYVQIFYFPDRVGHLFWQFHDRGHPLYDPVRAERWGGELLRAYKRMDAIVGKARRLAGDDAVFLVCSDHGFSSFRRGVNYNNWLVEQGLMVMKERSRDKANLEKLFDTRDLFAGVDWSRTKAYAMGLGSIYVNLAGREREGIVLPGVEYDEVRRQIREGLEALVDPASGERPVHRVYFREEMYSGFDPRLVPDLRAASSLNYRVSWQTSLGGFGESVIEDNLKAWSGDHCSNDPELVPGIFFANRPLLHDRPRMVDIMPTVLKLLGVSIPEGLDGRPVL